MQALALGLAPASPLRRIRWLRRAVLLALVVLITLNLQGGQRRAVAAPVPAVAAWSTVDALTFGGCEALAAWPHDRIPTRLVVERVADQDHVRLSFDRAWRLNHDRTEVDDVLVLGACS